MTKTLVITEQCRMKQSKIYPNIDMPQTGLQLKELIESSGYTTKMIQQYLHLSCPQPIYRWYKGAILPSVDHLLMLSELLGVHMEELLVKKQEKQTLYVIDCLKMQESTMRLNAYCKELNRIAA